MAIMRTISQEARSQREKAVRFARNSVRFKLSPASAGELSCPGDRMAPTLSPICYRVHKKKVLRMTVTTETLGRRLAEACTTVGLTQAQVGASLKVLREWVSSLEQGR